MTKVRQPCDMECDANSSCQVIDEAMSCVCDAGLFQKTGHVLISMNATTQTAAVSTIALIRKVTMNALVMRVTC